MPVRTGWEDIYGVQMTGAIGTAGTFGAATHGLDGATAGNCMIPLLNHPSIDPGFSIDFAQKTTGLAQNRYDTGNIYEYTLGKKQPKVSLEFGCTEKRMTFFYWLLFQQGAVQDIVGNQYQTTFSVPVAGQSGIETYCSVARSIGLTADADNHALHGCIANQITIGAASGERVKMAVELMGKTFVTNMSLSSTDLTVETSATERMIFDYTYTLAGTDITASLESWSVTVNNNAATKFYGGQTPTSYILNRFATNGSIKMAMSAATVGDNAQIDAFVAGTYKSFIATRGTTNIAGYQNIKVSCLYTGANVDPAEELMLELPFDGVYIDGSNESVKIIATANVDRAIG